MIRVLARGLLRDRHCCERLPSPTGDGYTYELRRKLFRLLPPDGGPGCPPPPPGSGRSLGSQHARSGSVTHLHRYLYVGGLVTTIGLLGGYYILEAERLLKKDVGSLLEKEKEERDECILKLAMYKKISENGPGSRELSDLIWHMEERLAVLDSRINILASS